MSNSLYEKPKKARLTITIKENVRDELMKIGNQNGLKISNMIERAAEYYLADRKSLEIAKRRAEDPKGVYIDAEEAERLVMEGKI